MAFKVSTFFKGLIVLLSLTTYNLILPIIDDGKTIGKTDHLPDPAGDPAVLIPELLDRLAALGDLAKKISHALGGNGLRAGPLQKASPGRPASADVLEPAAHDILNRVLAEKGERR
jgi:hypothetical protein